ncbi:MAG: hypothetical protein H0V02_05495, partial [Nocardioidaceae bacterium]|nr:hypothetical protein [Nocardioidaceae bacterium]
FQLNPIKVDETTPATAPVGNVSLTKADRPVFASYPRESPTVMGRWFADGVGRGFQRLSRNVRMAPGYSSIRQIGFNDTFCIKTSHGYTCDASAKRLLDAEPRTGQAWIDLLGYRTVVVFAGDKRQRLWKGAAGSDWKRVDKGTDFVKYRRSGQIVVAGRITYVRGDAEIRKLELRNSVQSYDVAAPEGAKLVFRDLYWPGYTAELDGEPLAVLSLSDILLMVELPPGAEGKLSVSYAPVSDAELAGLSAAGAGVVGVSMLLASVWRRRVRADLSETEAARASPVSDKSADVDRDGDKGEPDDGKALQDSV